MAVSKTVVGSSILSAPAKKNDNREMSKIGEYVKSSYDELMHKVSWPTFKELQSSAVVVAVATIVIALVVFVMDVVFGVQGWGWKGLLGYFYQIFG